MQKIKIENTTIEPKIVIKYVDFVNQYYPYITQFCGDKVSVIYDNRNLCVIGINELNTIYEYFDKLFWVTGIRTLILKNAKKDKTLCISCYINKRNTVFIGCGHECYCFDCFNNINKLHDNNDILSCPVCQTNSNVIKTYR